MKYIYFTFGAIITFFIISQSSIALKISGIITDINGKTLPNVTISIPATHLATFTDDSGKFVFEYLHPGVYTVEAKLIGFKTETRKVSIGSDDINISISMKESVLELPGIIVTGTPQPADILSSSKSITVVHGRDLDRLQGQNVIQLIEYTPGVSVYSTGAGIAKPVIRGLTSQRVLVVSDGVRQEDQQWGDEHAPEIDAFDVDRIEVLRGPSSVLYGSDAIGGVVNIIKPELPSIMTGASLLDGKFIFNALSNNSQLGGNLSILGAFNSFGYRASFSARNSNDINTPNGKLFNSGTRELNGGIMLGLKETWGAVMLDYSHFSQELQIHENPNENPGATPFQNLQHDKLHLHGDIPINLIRFEWDAGYQRNNRMEFEAKDAYEPVLNLLLNTYSFDLKAHHQPLGTLFGTLGMSIMHQNNNTIGEEKLIPGYNMFNIAVFLYEEVTLQNFILSMGVRFDKRNYNINKTPDLDVDSQTKYFHALTGNFGLVYRLSEDLSATFNIGRGWRSPGPFELFVNGVHEGTVQYLTGDRNLTHEQSLNLDISLRYSTHTFQGELSLFRNMIYDYIFISPTSEIDTISGFKKFRLKQADAILGGSELSLQAQVNEWLIISGGLDFISATNVTINKPLPMMPPNRLRFGLKLTTHEINLMLNPYLSFDIKIKASQERIEEFETRTGGYTLYSVGTGFELKLWKSRWNFDFTINNIFNKAYKEHLSRYKDYALNPGRDIQLKISVPFKIIE